MSSRGWLLFALAAPSIACARQRQPPSEPAATPTAATSAAPSASDPVPAPSERQANPTVLLSSEEVGALLPSLQAAAVRSDRWVTPPPPEVRVQQARKVPFPSGARIVSALQIEESCLLGVSAADGSSATLVVGLDAECRSIRFLSEADLNSDGVADFQYRIEVRSNRYPGYVEEQLLFLSDVASTSYCYPATLKNLLDPSRNHDATEVRALVARHGENVLKCEASP